MNSILLLILFAAAAALPLGILWYYSKQQRSLQQTIIQHQNSREQETKSYIASEFLHQQVINGLLLPHLIKIKELHTGVAETRGMNKKQILASVENLLDKTIEMERVIRTISEEIFPPFLTDYFSQSCQSHIEKLRLKYSYALPIHFNCTPNLRRDEPSFKLILFNLYSLIDLFVTNSIKHAAATDIRVVIEVQNNEITLMMSDNGIGFDTKSTFSEQKGRGIADFKSKATALTPNYTFESYKGSGTRFKIIVPSSEE
jgi:signal transduction histidine kinase